MTSGESSFGFRLADDYGQFYWNCWERSGEVPKDDLKFLAFAASNSDETGEAILSGVLDNKTGIHIDNTWYEFPKIRRVLTRTVGGKSKA
jgi:hypothetical protein